MISRSTRSAKSVAWMSEKVRGVSILRRLPRRVVCRTIGDEFHSLKTTGYPSSRSHSSSRVSWVLLPEPSMPSTMKSRPG